MPSLVNQVPPGLLSLLGIKALGINPSILPDELTPTLELRDLYVNGNAQILSGNVTLAGTGITPLATALVPAGQLWIVESMTLSRLSDFPGGSTQRVQPIVWQPTLTHPTAVADARTITGGERIVVTSRQPFIMAAGYQAGALCESFTGIANTFVLWLRYLALTV